MKTLSYKWQFLWGKQVKKAYEKYAPKSDFQKILSAIDNNPYTGHNIKKLRGDFKGLHRYRKGDFRIIYKINSKENKIELFNFASRGSSY